MSKNEKPQEFDPEVIAQTNREVRHGIAYIRMYHYLSTLQAVSALSTTKIGALVMPPQVLGSIGYGFTQDDECFCLHTTGFMFDLFSRLKPSVALIDDGGLTLQFNKLKYADYLLKPILLHFRIPSKKVFEKAKTCSYLTITKIEASYTKAHTYDVVDVLNPAIILEDKKSFEEYETGSLSRIF